MTSAVSLHGDANVGVNFQSLFNVIMSVLEIKYQLSESKHSGAPIRGKNCGVNVVQNES